METARKLLVNRGTRGTFLLLHLLLRARNNRMRETLFSRHCPPASSPHFITIYLFSCLTSPPHTHTLSPPRTQINQCSFPFHLCWKIILKKERESWIVYKLIPLFSKPPSSKNHPPPTHTHPPPAKRNKEKEPQYLFYRHFCLSKCVCVCVCTLISAARGGRCFFCLCGVEKHRWACQYIYIYIL